MGLLIYCRWRRLPFRQRQLLLQRRPRLQLPVRGICGGSGGSICNSGSGTGSRSTAARRLLPSQQQRPRMQVQQQRRRLQ